MRFADELRGSEGERCRVTDIRSGEINFGVIEGWNDGTGKAVVRYDDGRLFEVGYSFVSLVDEEK